MAHKKAGSSSKNGRDSVGQRLGVKAGDGQLVTAGSIIVRQRGMTFLAGPAPAPVSATTTPSSRRSTARVRSSTTATRSASGSSRSGRGRGRGRAPQPPSGDHRRGGPGTDGVGGEHREAGHPPQVLRGQACTAARAAPSSPSGRRAKSCASTSAATATRSSRASRRSSTPPGQVERFQKRLERQARLTPAEAPQPPVPTARPFHGRRGIIGSASRPAAFMARFTYGGQALIEGVLMRGRDAIAVARATPTAASSARPNGSNPASTGRAARSCRSSAASSSCTRRWSSARAGSCAAPASRPRRRASRSARARWR